MSDNMGIQKLYQFIVKETGGDLSQMDIDHNGTIVEAECRYYLDELIRNNQGEFNLEDKNARYDLISKFWKSINTNRSGNSIVSLDKNEIAAMEKRMGLESVLLKHVENLKAPNYTGINAKSWMEYVKTVISRAVEGHSANGKNGIDSFNSESELEEFIQQYSKQAQYEATLLCVADAAFTKALEREAFSKYGFSNDNMPSDLKSLIRDYMDDMLSTRVDVDDLNSLAKMFGDDIVTIINNYKNSDGYNELNKQKLIQDTLAPKLTTDVKNDTEAKKMLERLGDGVKSALSDAINEFLKSYVTESNYKDLKTNPPSLLTEFKESNFYKEMETNYRMATARDAVMEVLTPTENDTVAETLSEIKAVIIGESVSRTRIKKYVRNVLRSLHIEFSENDLNSYITEAKGTGLSLNKTDDCQKIALYVLEKYDVSENTKLPNKKKQSAMLDTLIEKGIKKGIAEAILSLSADDINNKYPEYQKVIDEVVKDYQDGKIADKAELVERLATEIKKLYDKEDGPFATIIKDYNDARNIEDKTSEIINSMDQDKLIGESKFTFYLDKEGKIVFVNYTRADSDKTIFNAGKNTALQAKFEEAKTKAEEAYSSQLEILEFSESDKDNLYNAALYMTLTDVETVSSFYDDFEIKTVIEKFIENYVKLLKKASESDKAMDYIRNWKDNSFLAGTTTNLGDSNGRVGSDMQGTKLTTDFGLLDNSTEGSDDMIVISGTEKSYLTYESYGGNIIHLTSGGYWDNKVANTTMDNMCKKYINEYKDILGGNKIIELFRQAQEAAINKLKAVKESDPDGNTMHGYQVYAYGDWSTSGKHKTSVDTNRDGYVGVSALMIQIEVEMEKLIGQAVLDL